MRNQTQLAVGTMETRPIVRGLGAGLTSVRQRSDNPEMARRTDEQRLVQELSVLLGAAFPGIEIEVGRNPRWPRTCLTFRWPGFAELLPEERFYRLVQVIPEEFRDKRLAGCVWLELAPGETVEEFLKHPRSDDVADQEQGVYARLLESGFFSKVAAKLGPSPDAACSGNFTSTLKVLSEQGFPSEDGRMARLVLIRNGAYCDCQVVKTALPALARLRVGVA